MRSVVGVFALSEANALYSGLYRTLEQAHLRKLSLGVAMFNPTKLHLLEGFALIFRQTHS